MQPLMLRLGNCVVPALTWEKSRSVKLDRALMPMLPAAGCWRRKALKSHFASDRGLYSSQTAARDERRTEQRGISATMRDYLLTILTSHIAAKVRQAATPLVKESLPHTDGRFHTNSCSVSYVAGERSIAVTLAWRVTDNHQLIIDLAQFGRDLEF